MTDIFDRAGCGVYAQPLRDAVAKRGVDINSLPFFLGQLSVESQQFSRVVENLNYRVTTLLAVCNGRNGITDLDDAAAAVAKGPQGVAEALYGGSWGASRLGNTEPGDGPRFIGRGLIQITGRWNYSNASRQIFGDQRLVDTPSLLTVANVAADAAGWFWMSKKLNGLTDVVAITKAINGGSAALAERQAATDALR